ncbi:MAG: pirin family protein [Pyrinomonadaceae bacterium]|nr:pirin family protein [Pyrinomonadaceae bacterium]
MINVRKSNERGHANHGWLDTYHTFSFNTYYDERFMNFRSLRVINEDRVASGEGFGTHGHKDMEIITYVVSGALAHKDSMGNGETLRPHEWQRMSAGTGIRHSEYNASDSETTHFLQIWLIPDEENLTPEYEQKPFGITTKTNKLKLVASKTGEGDSLKIHQDANLYNSILTANAQVTHEFNVNRHGYLQLIKGTVSINGNELKAGDGAAISDEKTLIIKSDSNDESEFLLFDLA